MDSYETWLRGTRSQLAAAVTEAGPLVERGQFDEAERIVRAVNSDM